MNMSRAVWRRVIEQRQVIGATRSLDCYWRRLFTKLSLLLLDIGVDWSMARLLSAGPV